MVTVFETHDENFARKGGGLGADLTTLQDIRQCDESPLTHKDGGPGTYFYGDLWKVHLLVTSEFFFKLPSAATPQPFAVPFRRPRPGHSSIWFESECARR